VTTERTGPLVGLRVLEMNAIGPVPFAGGILADLGAEVLRIEAPGPQLGVVDADHAIHLRGRSAVTVDLRDPDGLEVARQLADRADVLLEGYRPGVMERLGLDPDELLARNPGLIIGRMTGWGQDGPMAKQAGHDINYIAAAGALGSFARSGQAPVPPELLAGGLLLDLPLLACPLDLPLLDLPLLACPLDLPLLDLPLLACPLDLPLLDLPLLACPFDLPALDLPLLACPFDLPLLDLPLLACPFDLPVLAGGCCCAVAGGCPCDLGAGCPCGAVF
jgi:hypothetical protein